MRMVKWTDENGYMHRSLLKDSEGDDMAPLTAPQDPPLVSLLDWDEIKRDLHNTLVIRGLFDYKDLTAQQNGVTGAILSVMKRPVLDLYKKRRSGKE